MTSLSFIAVIPSEHLAGKVTALKEEIARRFDSKKALNSPPHITLVPPFNLHPDCKKDFISFLNFTVAGVKPFKISLNGFECFENRRRKNPVIFVHPEPSQEFNDFQKKLSQALVEKYDFVKKESRAFSPHMTIAFKDLSLNNFDKAWEEFKTREFRDEFIVSEIYLLQHTGNLWKVEEVLKFTGNFL